MTYWSRNDTKKWIQDLESRITDIEYYVQQTVKWLEDNEIYDQQKALACCFLTCIWVSHMRDEQISYKELLEILGIPIPDDIEDKIYDLGPILKNLEHYELLHIIAGNPSKYF